MNLKQFWKQYNKVILVSFGVALVVALYQTNFNLELTRAISMGRAGLIPDLSPFWKLFLMNGTLLSIIAILVKKYWPSKMPFLSGKRGSISLFSGRKGAIFAPIVIGAGVIIAILLGVPSAVAIFKYGKAMIYIIAILVTIWIIKLLR